MKCKHISSNQKLETRSCSLLPEHRVDTTLHSLSSETKINKALASKPHIILKREQILYQTNNFHKLQLSIVGRGGALVKSMTLNRRIVLYLQLPMRFGVKLRYSIHAVVGSASE